MSVICFSNVKKMIHFWSAQSLRTRNGLSTTVLNTRDHGEKMNRLKALQKSIFLEKNWWCCVFGGISKKSNYFCFYWTTQRSLLKCIVISWTNWMIYLKRKDQSWLIGKVYWFTKITTSHKFVNSPKVFTAWMEYAANPFYSLDLVPSDCCLFQSRQNFSDSKTFT